MRNAGRALHLDVIPAKAGIHFDLAVKSNMDSRVRGNDRNASTSAIAKNYCVVKGTY
jgi:hypothetical protein